MSGYLDIWIYGNLDIWISGYPDIWISGYLDIWISGSEYLDVWIANLVSGYFDSDEKPIRTISTPETSTAHPIGRVGHLVSTSDLFVCIASTASSQEAWEQRKPPFTFRSSWKQRRAHQPQTREPMAIGPGPGETGSGLGHCESYNYLHPGLLCGAFLGKTFFHRNNTFLDSGTSFKRFLRNLTRSWVRYFFACDVDMDLFGSKGAPRTKYPVSGIWSESTNGAEIAWHPTLA